MSNVSTTPEASVQDLAQRLVAGDSQALSIIYDRWSALVHTIALRATDSPATAADVTRRVFIRAWQDRSNIIPAPHTFPTWLIDLTKREVTAIEHDSRRNNADTSDAPETMQDDLADRLLLHSALDAMSEPHRTVLKMALRDNHDVSFISEQTAMAHETIERHIATGLQALDRYLTEVGRVS